MVAAEVAVGVAAEAPRKFGRLMLQPQAEEDLQSFR